MAQLAEFADWPEDLNAEEEEDHQRGQTKVTCLDADGTPRQGNRRPDKHGDVRDATLGDVQGKDRHCRLEEGPTPAGKVLAGATALPERLEGRQPLDGIDELRSQVVVRATAFDGSDIGAGTEQVGGKQGEGGKGEEEECRRQVDPCHEEEDADRCDERDDELGQVAPEVDVELLDRLDGGDKDITGASGAKRTWTEVEQVRVDASSQADLHAGGCFMPDELLQRNEGES